MTSPCARFGTCIMVNGAICTEYTNGSEHCDAAGRSLRGVSPDDHHHLSQNLQHRLRAPARPHSQGMEQEALQLCCGTATWKSANGKTPACRRIDREMSNSGKIHRLCMGRGIGDMVCQSDVRSSFQHTAIWRKGMGSIGMYLLKSSS